MFHRIRGRTTIKFLMNRVELKGKHSKYRQGAVEVFLMNRVELKGSVILSPS